VTQTGCGALCPRFGRGCFGCYGPMESANTGAWTTQLRALGQSDDEITRGFRSFNAWAWQFRQASDEAEKS
jgi:sulfhydrogenase subunit delta